MNEISEKCDVRSNALVTGSDALELVSGIGLTSSQQRSAVRLHAKNLGPAGERQSLVFEA